MKLGDFESFKAEVPGFLRGKEGCLYLWRTLACVAISEAKPARICNDLPS